MRLSLLYVSLFASSFLACGSEEPAPQPGPNEGWNQPADNSGGFGAQPAPQPAQNGFGAQDNSGWQAPAQTPQQPAPAPANNGAADPWGASTANTAAPAPQQQPGGWDTAPAPAPANNVVNNGGGWDNSGAGTNEIDWGAGQDEWNSQTSFTSSQPQEPPRLVINARTRVNRAPENAGESVGLAGAEAGMLGADSLLDQPGVEFELDVPYANQTTFLPTTSANYFTLISNLGAEVTPIERQYARQILVDMGSESVRYLAGGLKHTDPIVRANSALALGEIGDPSAIVNVIEVLDDENDHVRGQALVAVARMNITSIPFQDQIPFWQALYESMGDYARNSPFVRMNALLAASEIEEMHPEIYEQMISDLSEPEADDDTRAMARMAFNSRYAVGNEQKYRDYDPIARTRWQRVRLVQIEIHDIQKVLITVLATREAAGFSMTEAWVPPSVKHDERLAYVQREMRKYRYWTGEQIRNHFFELESMLANLIGLMAPLENQNRWVVTFAYSATFGRTSMDAEFRNKTVFEAQEIIANSLQLPTRTWDFTAVAAGKGEDSPIIAALVAEDEAGTTYNNEEGLDFTEDQSSVRSRRRRTDHFNWGRSANVRGSMPNIVALGEGAQDAGADTGGGGGWTSYGGSTSGSASSTPSSGGQGQPGGGNSGGWGTPAGGAQPSGAGQPGGNSGGWGAPASGGTSSGGGWNTPNNGNSGGGGWGN
ncbi:MAG: HEAT repeat domain-containing protein [Planctomycetes bacterium]|nr:HEAT repeat domain-containing protein [Planctomycetota bacterium]MCR4318224.1 HEAT repeat domain-containing protein [Planctomycetota bacterium]